MFREVAMVIDQNNRILDVQLGEPALVYFPQEFMWEQHKKDHGSILTMAHTHESMFDFSQEDLTTLKAWAIGLCPSAISMDVIVYDKKTNQAKQLRKTYQYIPTDDGAKKLLENGFEYAHEDLEVAPDWVEILGKLSYAC